MAAGGQGDREGVAVGGGGPVGGVGQECGDDGIAQHVGGEASGRGGSAARVLEELAVGAGLEVELRTRLAAVKTMSPWTPARVASLVPG